MPFTYLELKTKVKEDVFPDGEADNLILQHDKAILDGLVNLQRYVPCFQQSHLDVHPFCTLKVDCGATTVPKPEGRTQRVLAIEEGSWCSKVQYEVSPSFQAFEDWLGSTHRFTTPVNAGLPTLPAGQRYAEQEDPILSRPSIGQFVIRGRWLYVAPRLQAGEVLLVEWDGLKTRWLDTDNLPESMLDEEGEQADPTLIQALADYLRSDHSRKYGCDLQTSVTAQVAFADARGDLHYECAQETKPGLVRSSRLGRRFIFPTPPTPAEAEDQELVFAIISDFGHPTNGTAEFDVANMVKAWEPSFIVTAGDNHYGAPANYPAKVGAFYGDYITDDVATNRFWPALGNHDWVEAGLPAFQDYFALPGNERYYEILKQPVHFFILDSDPHEPSGVTATSAQAEWLRVRMRLSTAPWRIPIAQDAPYTAGTDRPGNTWMRWAFKAGGAHAVFSGDTHAYERFTVDGLPYIVAGTGGAPLITFGGLIDDSTQRIVSEARIATHGAIRGTATCATIKFEFIGIDGITYDALTLTKNADGSVTATSETNEAAAIMGIIVGDGQVVTTGEGGPIILP